jgi:MYXO-CTERM domain-containing protein
LSEETGAAIGVYSILFSSQCSGVGVKSAYTLVAPFKSLIVAALDAADQQPIPEPAESGGAGGDAGAPGEGGEAGAFGQGGAPSGAAGSSGAGGHNGAAGRASTAGGPAGGSGGTAGEAGKAGEDGTAGENADSAGRAGVRGVTSERTNAGCGCRVTGAKHESSWLLVSAAVIALWRRRR